MSANIIFVEDPSVTEPLQIVKKMSQGKFQVYHVYSQSQKTSYVWKIFPKDTIGTLSYTKEAVIARLSHQNIIKYIPAIVKFENDGHFNSIVSEFAKYGDVFDMVVSGLFASETLIRTYFHQVVAGLEYLHSQGVAHLDLKLENLMIGSDFTLKIIDFDQAQSTEDKKITSGGSDECRAPEVIDGSCTNFQAADIYSLGIVLYCMKAQCFPFAEIKTPNADGKIDFSLKYYSTFLKNNSGFWEMKASQKKNPEFFSEDFKQLVNGMLQFDISKRFTLNDVKNSDWFKGAVHSPEELKAEMKAKWLLSNSE